MCRGEPRGELVPWVRYAEPRGAGGVCAETDHLPHCHPGVDRGPAGSHPLAACERERCSPAQDLPSGGCRNQRCEDERKRQPGGQVPRQGVTAGLLRALGTAAAQRGGGAPVTDRLPLTQLRVEQPLGAAEETHSPSTSICAPSVTKTGSPRASASGQKFLGFLHVLCQESSKSGGLEAWAVGRPEPDGRA